MYTIILAINKFNFVCVCVHGRFRSQTQYQADPDSYNGATRENYSWSQDYTDVEIRVFVSKTVVKGRQVNTKPHHQLSPAVLSSAHSA